MRDEHEVQALLDLAFVESSAPREERSGLTYEEGVEATLQWVMGQVADNPLAVGCEEENESGH